MQRTNKQNNSRNKQCGEFEKKKTIYGWRFSQGKHKYSLESSNGRFIFILSIFVFSLVYQRPASCQNIIYNMETQGGSRKFRTELPRLFRVDDNQQGKERVVELRNIVLTSLGEAIDAVHPSTLVRRSLKVSVNQLAR